MDEHLHTITSLLVEDEPIVSFVNQILSDAIRFGASDIHFESYEHCFRIRYRQDGLLREIASPPLHLAIRLITRLKVMANLDISERRLPQDGYFKFTFAPTRTIDCRVSTCPTIAGEKVVIRLFDSRTSTFSVDTLGLTVQQKQHILKAIHRPQGLILVTGPTGSGKTITLYSALTLLNTTEKNISTVEDPVEMKLSGVNQVTVQPKNGLDFATVLRAFLRQDPDIIMIGEIRDLETATIAIQAAHTGHVVLSTLHTNSAAETITRLIHMGIPAFSIVSALQLVIAQRLVRKLCEQCKSKSDFLYQTDSALHKANVCPHCVAGYRGQLGLFEVMPISNSLAESILAGDRAYTIEQKAQKEGMLTLRQVGFLKIREGLTTLEELNRVTTD